MIEITRVEPDRWATVRKVRLAALRDAPDSFWATYDEERGRSETWWRDFVAAGAWFLAGPPEDAGVVAVLPSSDLGEGERQLISMWVDPSYRGSGVGAALVGAAIGWARVEGVRSLQLQVAQENHAARRLYHRRGFRPTGTTEPLPRKPSVIEVEMRLFL